MEIATFGQDLAERTFQVRGADRDGGAGPSKRLRPGDVEAVFPAPPPSYVKACVRRGRTDAADAEAVREAVTRPRMHAVPVETADQRAALTLHRAHLLARWRAAMADATRRHMAEPKRCSGPTENATAQVATLMVGQAAAQAVGAWPDAFGRRRCRALGAGADQTADG